MKKQLNIIKEVGKSSIEMLRKKVLGLGHSYQMTIRNSSFSKLENICNPNEKLGF